MRLLLLSAAVSACLVLSACAGQTDKPAETRGSFRGLVTTIRMERNDRLVVFSVQSDQTIEMRDFEYELGPAQPLDVMHLREHMDQRLPVTVNYTRSGSARGVAREILD